MKPSHLGRGGGAAFFGSAKYRTHQREALRDSRWKVSSVSTIPEKLAVALLLLLMESISIRQRQTAYLLSPSRRARLRTDCGAAVPSISRSATMNRSGRWSRPMALPVLPE